MNKSIDICTKVIYNKDNSKSPLCILRNYTRAKLQGSKTMLWIPKGASTNYTRAKLQGSKTRDNRRQSEAGNYTRAKLQGSKTHKYHSPFIIGTTPVQNCRGLKHLFR